MFLHVFNLRTATDGIHVISFFKFKCQLVVGHVLFNLVFKQPASALELGWTKHFAAPFN